MRKKGFKIVVFLACIFVGYFIALNTNLDNIVSFNNQLDAKGYQDAVEEKLSLYNEIANLKEINNELRTRVKKYERADERQETIYSDMKMQLSEYGLLTGLTEAQGPGVVITIKDGIMGNNNQENRLRTFHDYDMRNLINEFRNCGVEAMSVNDYRIPSLSGVLCHGLFLKFQDQSVVYGPFKIYLLGDADTLKVTLLKEGSYLNTLKSRGIIVTLEKADNIILPAAKPSTIKYAKEYIK